MIGAPVNDTTCLGSITEQIAAQVAAGDPVLAELAQRHGTAEQLARWIRGLPQRDDEGTPGDGPKVEACAPPQRLRVPTSDPNCVERAALYIAVAELIDSTPTRQLATINTPYGLHTFPVENGAPIALDPDHPRNGLRCGLAMVTPGPVGIDAHDAIEWSALLAADGAGTTHLRNGASRVARARNAVYALVDRGVVPASSDVDAMGWMFALAETGARRFGRRALQMVRTVAAAISEVIDEALAQGERNAQAPAWAGDPLVTSAARVGVRAGLDALAPGLGALAPTMLGAVETELNREGFTLGPFGPRVVANQNAPTPPPNQRSAPRRTCGCAPSA